MYGRVNNHTDKKMNTKRNQETNIEFWESTEEDESIEQKGLEENSVRHNLSLNKCFAKVDNPKLSSGAKKGCLWALNPAKIKKMEEEICKWSKKDPVTLLNSMAYPENLQAIEKGQAGLPTRKDDENYQTPPSSPIKDATAAIARHYDELEHIKEEPLESYDLELMNELAAHGHHWSTESGDLHIDLISNSSIVSSPVTVQSSPAPHTPSHSAYKSSTPTMYQGTFYASSPLRIITGSPSVRMNLFGVVTPPRTLSAQN